MSSGRAQRGIPKATPLRGFHDLASTSTCAKSACCLDFMAFSSVRPGPHPAPLHSLRPASSFARHSAIRHARSFRVGFNQQGTRFTIHPRAMHAVSNANFICKPPGSWMSRISGDTWKSHDVKRALQRLHSQQVVSSSQPNWFSMRCIAFRWWLLVRV